MDAVESQLKPCSSELLTNGIDIVLRLKTDENTCEFWMTKGLAAELGADLVRLSKTDREQFLDEAVSVLLEPVTPTPIPSNGRRTVVRGKWWQFWKW